MTIALDLPSAVRVPAVLGLFCLAPGTALVMLLRAGKSRIELGLALIGSLAVVAVAAQSMLWLGVWWPRGFAYGLAGACMVALVARLVWSVGRSRRGSESSQSGATPDEPFVSVVVRPAAGAALSRKALESLLGVDYKSFEVVVVDTERVDHDVAVAALTDPRLRYASHLQPDLTDVGDVLVFAEADTVVDSGWLQKIVHGFTYGRRVGCVRAPATVPTPGTASNGAGDVASTYAVTREALVALGGLEAYPVPNAASNGEHGKFFLGLLVHGWAIAYEPTATVWHPPRRTVSDRLRAIKRATEAVPASSLGHAAVIVAALGAWALSLLGADLNKMSGLGLLDAVPVTYFFAFGLLLGGFATAATREVFSPRILALYVIALVVVLHATTALLYDEPRYAWTYKHLGVINLIGATGRVDRGIDIYNNWPAFFAANAWFSNVLGLAPISYAAWAQLFFNLANVVAARFALLGVTRNERLLWTATFFLVIGNWVGQDYLAPQAFAFPLTLVILGLCLRCSPAPRRPRWRLRGLRQFLSRYAGTPPAYDEAGRVLPEPPLSSRAALAIGTVCFLAVVVSHQLSPVILILGVCALSLVLLRVPLWIPAAMVAIEVWWVALAWPFVNAHFDLFTTDVPGSVAPTRDAGAALPGSALSLYAPVPIVGLIVLLALAGAVRRLRSGHRDLAPACLALTPFLVVAAQSYGGEAAFRAYLFALPWLAFFAAAAFIPLPSSLRQPLARSWRLLAASAAIGGCLLFAYFGKELVNRFEPDDVRAVSWYEQQAPPRSAAMYATPYFPNRLTADYARVSLADPPGLVQRLALNDHPLSSGDIPRVERVIRTLRERHVFLILSNRQEDWGRFNGLLQRGSMSSLVESLSASKDFRIVFQRPTSWVFEYVGPSHTPS